jgi:hypothetical protein
MGPFQNEPRVIWLVTGPPLRDLGVSRFQQRKQELSAAAIYCEQPPRTAV